MSAFGPTPEVNPAKADLQLSVTPLRLGAVEEPLVNQGRGRTPLAIREPRGRKSFLVDPALYSPTAPAEQPADGVKADDRATWGRSVS